MNTTDQLTKRVKTLMTNRLFYIVKQPKRKDTMKIEVELLDNRTIFGRTEYRIIPKGGEGAIWVKYRSLIIDK